MKPGELYASVSALLGEQGAFAAIIPDWRASAEQLEYARCVCRWLEARHFAPADEARAALATLEGATGIGKTFGYLVPLLVYAQLTGRRVAVATCTLDLLHDIMDRSIPLANRLVAEHLGLPVLSTGERVGIAEHVSADRVMEVIENLSPPDNADIAQKIAYEDALSSLRGLHQFAMDARMGTASGYLRDWQSDGQGLPAGIGLEEVCLKSWCSDEDKTAYNQMKARAKSSAVQVMTQKQLLMHCTRYFDVLSGESDSDAVDAVVVDEADHVESMAETLVNGYLSVNDVLRVLRHIEHDGKKTFKEQIHAIEKAAHDVVAELHTEDARYALIEQSQSTLQHSVAQLVSLLGQGLAMLRKERAVVEDEEWRQDVVRWQKKLDQFADVLGRQSRYCCAYLYKSPVVSALGLGVMEIEPGQKLSSLWKENSEVLGVQALMLTSATLAPNSEKGLQWYWRTVGINTNHHRVIEEACAQLEPRKYGDLTFVYADPRVPKPFTHEAWDDETQGQVMQYSDAWLAYTVSQIQCARHQGGRILVLCVSYRDCEMLSAYLNVLGLSGVIAGQRGHRKSEMAQFVANPEAIWLSPAVWEGLDMPGMIDHVVVARVPYVSLDSALNAARQQALQFAGYSEEQSYRFVQSTSTFRATRKLRQGIGRAIRKVNDKATIWIADPRFPLPIKLADAWMRKHREKLSPGDKALLNAIPIRFRQKPASIFTMDGNHWSIQ